MEAGAAHPLVKVPSRPPVTKPPFARPPFPPHIPLTRPVHMGAPLASQPVAQDHRPVGQDHRPVAQDYRPMNQERRGAVPRQVTPAQARDNWRRRRAARAAAAAPPPPPPARDYPRTVQATGFPGYTRPQDLIHAFSEFGPAKVERIGGGAAALTFATPEQAAAAVRASAAVCLYGEFLAVQPYGGAAEHPRGGRNHREADKGKAKGPTVDPASLPWEGGFHQQLDALLAAVRLSQAEITQLAALYRDLETVLKAAWPGCLTIPFGSVTTGLGVKASDADCFVLLPGGAGAAAAAARAQAVPRARRLLAHHPHVFSSLVAIPNANTPIVKFFHLPTRTHCDVSFKTLLGVQNSKLIHFLLYADPRLLPLAVVVKYWAAVHELSGTGKLTNYALTMLIIFYLQQAPDPILPSVAWLQRDRATDFVVDGWNTGFMNDRERLSPTANKSSIADLIGGFFQFYTRFDFAESVVCPYLGYAIKKDTFKDLNKLPPEFERYKTNVAAGAVLPMRFNTNLCVQDPFEQCHNVASAVTSRLATEIRAYFKFAADTYEKDKPDDCKNFLKTILLEKPKLPRVKGKTEFRVNLYANTLTHITAPDWRSVVKEVIHSIFDNILKLKLEPVDRNASDTEEAPEAPQKNREKNKYTAVLTRAIWKRKQFSKLYSAMKLGFLEREQKITEDIMTTDKNEINIPFQLAVTYVQSPRAAVFAVRPGAGDLQTFKEFGKFFQSVMLHWFLVLSKPYCEKPEKKDKPPTPAAEHTNADVKSQAEEVKDAEVNDEVSDSDSDSDASTEDERVPPDAQMESAEQDINKTQSDCEQAPSDADKENIEDTNNVDSNKNATNLRTQSPKTQNDKGRSHKDKTNDALNNSSIEICEDKSDKSLDCSSAIQNGGLPEAEAAALH